ncbi:hypothetical protein SJPD1_1960 [Sulfurospirillum diekertiae]|uniref:Nucleotidyl transferase AbiEii/AbiGii toxin family protein n=1 Tax=Sulfurospirillum diekertiae TaxID=1854492 RepID=A0A290HF77_9BACT|nr:nucleotidyl transferase AbiEii/AbiGii toxin family protein [Sulfurospirillum diekertiae]ATB70065.1 hypothetical protein SJPD1_1960 [Sulfurospirillum diekertiae]
MDRLETDLLHQKAAAFSQNSPALEQTIIKELLHYDIIEALYKSEIAKEIVFQGGTALRLCYGAFRYSEDLDFVLKNTNTFTPELMKAFNHVFIQSIKKKYGLKAQVDTPKLKASDETKNVDVKKWTAKIMLPSTQMRQPKINIEIANVPSYDHSIIMVKDNYTQKVGGSMVAALNVESKTEILADKLIAVAGRSYFKARDFWDIKYLIDDKNTLNPSLVYRKIKDYQIQDFQKKFDDKVKLLDDGAIRSQFIKEMERFLDIDMVQMMQKPEVIDSIFKATIDLGRTLSTIDFENFDNSVPSKKEEEEFNMFSSKLKR